MRLGADATFGKLLANVDAVATQLTVSAQFYSRCPQPGPSDFVAAVLNNGGIEYEVVWITTNPRTGALAVIRGRENSTAQAWPVGTDIRVGVTWSTFNDLIVAQNALAPVIADLPAVLAVPTYAAEVEADRQAVAADKATVAADKNAVAVDRGVVTADRNAVANDRTVVAADRAATQLLADDFASRYLGIFASDAAAQTAHTAGVVTAIVNGSIYFNSTSQTLQFVTAINPIVSTPAAPQLSAGDLTFITSRASAQLSPINTNISNLQSEQGTQNTRLSNLESADGTINSRLNTAESNISAIISVNNSQGSSISALASENGTQNTRLTSVENVNAAQDSTLSSHGGRLNSLEGQVVGIEHFALGDAHAVKITFGGVSYTIQNGSAIVNSNSTLDITLPVPFNTANYGVSASHQAATTGESSNISVIAVSENVIRLVNAQGGNREIHWIAAGR